MLRLLRPQEIALVDRSYQRERLRRHVFLCHVAYRRWKMNSVQDPPSLAAMLQAAGIESPPIDPYSGKALQIAEVRGRQAIISFGPDGDSDHGEPALEFGPFYDEPTDGDFVFLLD